MFDGLHAGDTNRNSGALGESIKSDQANEFEIPLKSIEKGQDLALAWQSLGICLGSQYVTSNSHFV